MHHTSDQHYHNLRLDRIILRLMISTYQFHRGIVSLNEFVRQFNFGDGKADSMKAELPRSVHAPQLHVHGNKLHSTNTSVAGLQNY